MVQTIGLFGQSRAQWMNTWSLMGAPSRCVTGWRMRLSESNCSILSADPRLMKPLRMQTSSEVSIYVKKKWWIMGDYTILIDGLSSFLWLCSRYKYSYPYTSQGGGCPVYFLSAIGSDVLDLNLLIARNTQGPPRSSNSGWYIYEVTNRTLGHKF